jgi:bis(5'-nucleosyl)-tetraphosphatase (symmetrical)
VVFGHWSALGLLQEPGVVALDSGVAWGGPLSAVRLEDGRLVQADNLDVVARSF